ncbi:DMT family transporter [Caloramator australicus]|uniref:Permease of the drug/metabolite transporter (DMT) superfamily n=1 Tax=Caloramator australicus RC3 TaxID=857293 RepID=I7LK09_9CLOT|nr:EamA family transporter [Caloramator australicus]CCJ34123.1 Permease of the drug/metabolite transporter (DMT) superfamily [Caloramator australicus RC3]
MKKAILSVLFSAFVFSTLEVAGKLISGELNAFQVTFIRFFIGALVLFPFVIKDLKKREINLKRDDFLFLLLEGVLCIPVSMALLQLSVYFTKASTAAVVMSTNPIFMVIFSYFILGERINKRTIGAIIISFIGVLFIFNPLKLSYDIKGMLIALLAAVTFSLYSVLSKKRISKYGGYIFNFFSFLLGDIVLFILLLLFKVPILQSISSKNIPVLLYMGIFITGLGYIFYLYAIEKTTAAISSFVFFIKPALAPILSVLMLGEKISFNVVLGIMFIILGTVFAFGDKLRIKN